jgi:hypothetical protein
MRNNYEYNFKEGDTIRIISMDGVAVCNGSQGVIEFIDGMGQLHGTWGGLAVIPSIDEIELVKKESVK